MKNASSEVSEDYLLVQRVTTAWKSLRRGNNSGMRDYLCRPDDPHQIELGQLDALDILAQQASWRMSEFADAMRVDPSTATRAVERLVKQGFAVRESGSVDGRVVHVAITPVGREAVEVPIARRSEMLLTAVATFTKKEREQFVDLFERFAIAVEKCARDWRRGNA